MERPNGWMDIESAVAQGCPLHAGQASRLLEYTKAIELQVDELKKIIHEALPFMRARHEWKPSAAHADMIQAMEKAVLEKQEDS